MISTVITVKTKTALQHKLLIEKLQYSECILQSGVLWKIFMYKMHTIHMTPQNTTLYVVQNRSQKS